MKTVLIWLTLCFGTLMTTCANGTAYLFPILSTTAKTDCIWLIVTMV